MKQDEGTPHNHRCENLKSYRIAQSVWRRAMGWMAKVRFPAVQDFSLLHSVHTDSGAHPVSYAMGTGSSFPRGKAAEA
jgi:hypothetical protein